MALFEMWVSQLGGRVQFLAELVREKLRRRAFFASFQCGYRRLARGYNVGDEIQNFIYIALGYSGTYGRGRIH